MGRFGRGAPSWNAVPALFLNALSILFTVHNGCKYRFIGVNWHDLALEGNI